MSEYLQIPEAGLQEPINPNEAILRQFLTLKNLGQINQQTFLDFYEIYERSQEEGDTLVLSGVFNFKTRLMIPHHLGIMGSPELLTLEPGQALYNTGPTPVLEAISRLNSTYTTHPEEGQNITSLPSLWFSVNGYPNINSNNISIIPIDRTFADVNSALQRDFEVNLNQAVIEHGLCSFAHPTAAQNEGLTLVDKSIDIGTGSLYLCGTESRDNGDRSIIFSENPEETADRIAVIGKIPRDEITIYDNVVMFRDGDFQAEGVEHITGIFLSREQIVETSDHLFNNQAELYPYMKEWGTLPPRNPHERPDLITEAAFLGIAAALLVRVLWTRRKEFLGRRKRIRSTGDFEPAPKAVSR